MLEFLLSPPYDERKVENTEINGVVIDTCAVNDSSKPFETGISSPLYGGRGGWVIVELYDTKEKAKKGHGEWVKKFKDENKFPEFLKDVSDCDEAMFGYATEDERIFKLKK